MSPAALIIDSVLELAMICVSLYGAATLPSGARMPVHFGPAGYNQWVPRNVGLILWPGLGAIVSVIIVVATRDHQTHGSLGPTAGLSIALGVMLVAQIGALAVALGRSRRGLSRSAVHLAPSPFVVRMTHRSDDQEGRVMYTNYGYQLHQAQRGMTRQEIIAEESRRGQQAAAARRTCRRLAHRARTSGTIAKNAVAGLLRTRDDQLTPSSAATSR
jgi:hypothetical protein